MVKFEKIVQYSDLEEGHRTSIADSYLTVGLRITSTCSSTNNNSGLPDDVFGKVWRRNQRLKNFTQ